MTAGLGAEGLAAPACSPSAASSRRSLHSRQGRSRWHACKQFAIDRRAEAARRMRPKSVTMPELDAVNEKNSHWSLLPLQMLEERVLQAMDVVETIYCYLLVHRYPRHDDVSNSSLCEVFAKNSSRGRPYPAYVSLAHSPSQVNGGRIAGAVELAHYRYHPATSPKSQLAILVCQRFGVVFARATPCFAIYVESAVR